MKNESELKFETLLSRLKWASYRAGLSERDCMRAVEDDDQRAYELSDRNRRGNWTLAEQMQLEILSRFKAWKSNED